MHTLLTLALFLAGWSVVSVAVGLFLGAVFKLGRSSRPRSRGEFRRAA